MSEPIKKPINSNSESYSPQMPKLANMLNEARGESNYPETFVLPDKGTIIPPEIKHYGPAYVPFANEFSHFLDYTGQGYGFIFDGDWCKDRSYTIADILTGHAMQPAPLFISEEINYLWKTAGFTSCHTFYANSANGVCMSETEMKETIKYALYTLKQPVILPHESHWWGSIVIGYKDNGNVLLVYYYPPHFMDMEFNARYKIEELADWFNDNTSLFIAGTREKTLSLADIYSEGFSRIHADLADNIRGEKRRYYDEWEAFLRLGTDEMIAYVKQSGTVPGGDRGPYQGEANDEGIWNFIYTSHDSTWCSMAERRFYVMNFFRQAQEFFPEEKEALQALGDHFWYTCEIMGNRDTGYGSEIGDPVDADIFIKSEVRARMADCVRRFKEADEKGLEMAEKLITRLGL